MSIVQSVMKKLSVKLKQRKGIKMSHKQILKENEDKRTKCVVYTRVMGYHRPVESFNIGKQGEHKQRCYFSKKS